MDADFAISSLLAEHSGDSGQSIQSKVSTSKSISASTKHKYAIGTKEKIAKKDSLLTKLLTCQTCPGSQ